MYRQRNTLILFLICALLSVTTLNAQPTNPQSFKAQAGKGNLTFPQIAPAPQTTGRAPGNFTVDTVDDTEDVNLGDEICADASGDCSLRAAVQEANNIDPGSTISVPAGTYVLTVNQTPNFATALLIAQTMTITGAGVGQTIIDGNDTSGIFAMNANAIVIEDLTLTGGGGFTLPSTNRAFGAVFQLAGSVLLRRVSIENNRADDVGAMGLGGTVSIVDSTIMGNQALTGAEGYGTGGVYISNTGSLTLTNVTVSENTSATFVGGIYLDGGSLTVENSAIINNASNSDVGAIGPAGGTADLRNVTISGNTTDGQGGGMYPISGAIVDLNTVTIADNSASSAGGGIVNSGATVNMSNSILALNSAPSSPECSGVINSTGDNLIGDTGGGCLGAAGDIVEVDPLLDPLAVSPGADTATHALQELSPAIDAANDATCELVDQRGVARPQREGCDIGAFELEPLIPTETPTSTPTDGPSPTPTVTFTPTLEPGVTELLLNGDFENLGTDGKPDVTPWIVKNETGEKGKCNKDKDGDGIADKIFANTGNCAFQFKGEVGESGKLEQDINLINVNIGVGDALNLSFAAQTKSGGEGKAKVIFKYGDDTKTKISVSIGDTSELYQPFVGSGTITSTDIVKSKVSFKLTTEVGKMYLDGVSLQLVSAGGSETPTQPPLDPTPVPTETPPARLNGSTK